MPIGCSCKRYKATHTAASSPGATALCRGPRAGPAGAIRHQLQLDAAQGNAHSVAPTYQVVRLFVGAHAPHRPRPDPQPLGAGPVAVRQPEAGRLAQQLVQDKGLACRVRVRAFPAGLKKIICMGCILTAHAALACLCDDCRRQLQASQRCATACSFQGYRAWERSAALSGDEEQSARTRACAPRDGDDADGRADAAQHLNRLLADLGGEQRGWHQAQRSWVGSGSWQQLAAARERQQQRCGARARVAVRRRPRAAGGPAPPPGCGIAHLHVPGGLIEADQLQRARIARGVARHGCWRLPGPAPRLSAADERCLSLFAPLYRASGAQIAADPAL